MKQQTRLFFAALTFLTRIPAPSWFRHYPGDLDRATRYFPLIGCFVGLVSAFVFWASLKAFSREVAILLSMIASLILTGAFHEDGFADFCDGFGGGGNRDRILEIMKDSRIGSFGAIGIVISLLLKYNLLFEIGAERLPILLVCGHATSRLFPSFIARALRYARPDSEGKGTVKPHLSDLFIATLFALSPIVYYRHIYLLVPLTAAAATTVMLGIYMRRWIGGHTGDCLGAVQQVTEIIFYAATVVTWTFI